MLCRLRVYYNINFITSQLSWVLPIFNRKFSLHKMNKSKASPIFEGAGYAKNRPDYPVTLYKEILTFAQRDPNKKYGTCLDVACGTGQATLALANYFDKVIGVDHLDTQLQNAVKKDNIVYMKSTAEDIDKLGFPEQSFDVIIVAQAAHWFDMAKFYVAADKLLKPGGTLAMWGYGVNSLNHKEADNYFINEYYKKVIDKYWEAGREHLDNEYKSIPLPNYSSAERRKVSMEKVMNLEGFMGYLTTWSALIKYKKLNSDDPLVEVEKILKQFFGNENITVTWPIYLLLATK